MSDNGWRHRVIERKRMRVGDLLPNKYNPVGHGAGQKSRMQAVLDKFGVVTELVAYYNNDGKLALFDGHLRQGLDPGQEWDVAITDLSQAECDELALYFDPLAGMSTPDGAIMTALMQDLQDVDGVLGEMLEELAADAGIAFADEPPEDPGPQVDKAAELQEKWQVERAQVWQCGEHLVICGDCREPETWDKLLMAAGTKKVNGVFTSPPYAEQRKKQYGGVPVGEYVEWWEAVQANVRAHLAQDGSFFVNIKPHCEKGERVLYVFDLVLAMKRRWGWRFVDELCRLVQTTPGKWPNRFKNGFEPVYHFSIANFKFRPENVSWKGETFKADGKTHYDGKSAIRGIRAKFEGEILPSNIIQARAGEGNHPAVFSVALPDFFIRAYSDPGDVWIDPFLGSGTTIVAAHQNERRGLGIEMLEKYVSVTLDRLQRMGLEPRLVGG